METKNEEACLKIRSTRATIAAGTRLYLSNFRRIFRITWLPALLCAIVSALYYQTMISATVKLQSALTQIVHGPTGQGNTMQGLTDYLLQSGVSLLNLIVSILLMAYIFYLLSRHRQEDSIPYPPRFVTKPDGRSLMRTVAAAIVWTVAFVIAFALPAVVVFFGAAIKSMTTMALGALLMLILILALLIPLTYPTMRYVTTRDTRLFDLLGKGCVQGLRYWGYIFSVLFVVALMTTIILAVTMLPTIILLSANMKAHAGVAIGDPLGMPSYMGWLSFLVFTLSGFIQAYILIASFMPLYYMAGSIEQQEIQRNETKKDTLH